MEYNASAPRQEHMLESSGRDVIQSHSDNPSLGGCVTGPAMSQAVSCFCCGNCLVCAWWTQVNQNEQKALLYWGQYFGTLVEPGLYCVNPCGVEVRAVSTKFNTMSLKDVKVADQRGNPVIISAIVTYRLMSAKCASVDVDQPENFIRMQATATMKQIASMYPYSAAGGAHSLQSEGTHLSERLKEVLQEKSKSAGALVHNFELVDLSYAPEIAQVMLVKQQAEALVDARKLIVKAAVDMAMQAVKDLEHKQITLSESARERVTSNLLAVICSHSPSSTTVPVSSSGQQS